MPHITVFITFGRFIKIINTCDRSTVEINEMENVIYRGSYLSYKCLSYIGNFFALIVYIRL